MTYYIKKILVCYVIIFFGMFTMALSVAQPLNEDGDSCFEEVQSEQFPSYIPRARWSESWSRLRVENPRCSQGQLPFKHISLGSQENHYVSFGGEYRYTYERYSPDGRGLSETSSNSVMLHRFAGHMDWRPADEWRLFAQLGGAESSGRAGGSKAGDESNINIWQLFVDRRIALSNNERMDIRVGRQFIEKYNFLVGAGEARNVRQYYDGARVAWIDNGFAKLDVYAAEFVDAAEDTFAMSGTGEFFWGVNSELRFNASNLSLLYFGWALKNLQFEQGGGERHDEIRHTFTVRWHRPQTIKRQWLYDSYFIYQLGEYDDISNARINAHAIFTNLKYAFYPKTETAILGIKLGFFSGDHDSSDSKLTTFYDPIFVTPYFSYARDVMPYNLIHVQPNISYRFSENLQVTLSNDFLWKSEKNDAFYTGVSAIGVSSQQSDSRYIGNQIRH